MSEYTAEEMATWPSSRLRAHRSVMLRRKIEALGDPDLLELQEQRDFLEMDNCGWREISGEWAALARQLVPADFDFGHGCPTCTIGRVLDHLVEQLEAVAA